MKVISVLNFATHIAKCREYSEFVLSASIVRRIGEVNKSWYDYEGVTIFADEFSKETNIYKLTENTLAINFMLHVRFHMYEGKPALEVLKIIKHV